MYLPKSPVSRKNGSKITTFRRSANENQNSRRTRLDFLPAIFAHGQAVQKTPEQVAQSLVDAYNARNMDGILKAYSPDSVAYALPSGEIILKGHDAIRKKFARILEPNVNLRVDIVNRIVDGKYNRK